MTCGHDENYTCPRCKECYYCRHEVVMGNWPDISVGWRCPSGQVRPAYGPGRKK